MARADSIHIEDRVYHRNPEVDRFQVELKDLGALRMADIPANSHLEVLGIPMPETKIECEVWFVNAGDYGSGENLSVYGGASIPVTPDTASAAMRRLRRAFPDLHPYDSRRNPQISVVNFTGRLLANAHLSLTVSFKRSAMDSKAPRT